MIVLFTSPFIAALLLFFSPEKNIKRTAFFFSLAPLLSLFFAKGTAVNILWFPALDVHFHLAVDSLSFLFLSLVVWVTPFAILAKDGKPIDHPRAYYSLMLILQGLLIAFFTSRDLAFFTLFWEAMLLPLYFLITKWGGEGKEKAAFTFLIYMIAGSALMVAAVLALYFAAGTFDLDQLSGNVPQAKWIFLVFLLAFAVKTPLFPFHAWLPDVYTTAPVGGTILLSALLSKAGIYGIIRIGMGLFPDLLQAFGPTLLVFAIVGVFYGGFSAWAENDFKRLIAYSSFSHVNFILAGLFVWSDTAHSGATLQAINHGVTITALFLVAGWLEERMRSSSMRGVGGLAEYLPHLAWLTLFFVLASIALPGTNNFIGELLILFGLFGLHPWLAATLTAAMVLSAIYMLRLMQKVYFEEPTAPPKGGGDIRGKELLIALPLAAAILWIGIYPAPLIKFIGSF